MASGEREHALLAAVTLTHERAQDKEKPAGNPDDPTEHAPLSSAVNPRR